MAERALLLAEAYRRGLLSPEQKAAFEEARRRGLVKRGAKRSLVDDVTGFMATVNSRIPLADEFAGAAQTASNLMTGRIGVGDIPEDFSRSMGRQRGYEADLEAARPRVAALARGTGDAALAAVPTAPVAATFASGAKLANIGRGAVTAGMTGAGIAATDRGTLEERAQAASAAARNPLLLAAGAGAGALAPAASRVRDEVAAASRTGAGLMTGRVPLSEAGDDFARNVTAAQAPKPRTDAAILREIGVETSAPQRAGGMVKQAEDLAMRAPILGGAIRGARGREVEQFNRGIGLKALESVGKPIPKEIKPGFEMVEYVDDALGQVYDDAARLVPEVRLDRELQDEFTRISARTVDLADSEAAQFARIIDDRTQRLQNGASGEMVKKIHSELGDLQREHMRKGNETLASMIGETRRAIMGLIERANPQAGEMIRRADEGWTIYSMMNDAAAQASNRGGVFLPGQYNAQVRSAGRRLGSNMAGKGRAPTQEIATAAASMIPDSYGNPGTADALGMGALGVHALHDPVSGAGIATGLMTAATPYWLMGRKVLEELPPNATRSQLVAADAELARLAAADPAVAALRREVAARLSVAAGVVSAPDARAAAR